MAADPDHADTGYIVFARLDSRRLPGKALLDLAGKPLLARVLERLRLAADGRPVVVATSDRPTDDPIADLATREGAGLFRGACDDVAGRALACAEALGFIRFVRVSGDSPFVDPALCRKMVARAETGEVDLVTNLHPRGFPPGCSIEVITAAAMRRLCAVATTPEHREHVTAYVYEHPEEFRLLNIAPDHPIEQIPLTVDTLADLDSARALFRAAGGAIGARGIEEIVALARRHAPHPTDTPA